MLIEVEGVTSSAVTHAFVVGVSHYPFLDGPEATPLGEQLGMANLSSAARSASEVAGWLLDEYHNPEAPLASVRLLLSPVEGEQLNAGVLARMGGQAAPATRAAVKTDFTDFKAACATNTDNRAFVYLVGHGIQLNFRGAIVLLEDFATAAEEDLLFGSIDVMRCHEAMQAGGNADRQVWFSDACRQRPEIVKRFESLSGAFAPGNVALGEVSASPVFLSSSSRENAFSDPAGLTIFTEALLWALSGAGAVGKDESSDAWHVSSTRLTIVLPGKVKALARAGGADQSIDLTGKPLDVVVQQFENTPEVDVEVALLPEGLDPAPVAQLLFEGRDPVAVDDGWPLRFRGKAGIYQLTADSAGPAPKRGTKLFAAQPPSCRDEVEVR